MEFEVFQLNLNSDEITCIESRSQQKIWGEEILSLALLGDAGKEGLFGLHSDFPKLPQSSSPSAAVRNFQKPKEGPGQPWRGASSPGKRADTASHKGCCCPPPGGCSTRKAPWSSW